MSRDYYFHSVSKRHLKSPCLKWKSLPLPWKCWPASYPHTPTSACCSRGLSYIDWEFHHSPPVRRQIRIHTWWFSWTSLHPIQSWFPLPGATRRDIDSDPTAEAWFLSLSLISFGSQRKLLNLCFPPCTSQGLCEDQMWGLWGLTWVNTYKALRTMPDKVITEKVVTVDTTLSPK